MQKDMSSQSSGDMSNEVTEEIPEDIGRVRSGSLHSQIIASSKRPDDPMSFYAEVLHDNTLNSSTPHIVHDFIAFVDTNNQDRYVIDDTVNEDTTIGTDDNAGAACTNDESVDVQYKDDIKKDETVTTTGDVSVSNVSGSTMTTTSDLVSKINHNAGDIDLASSYLHRRHSAIMTNTQLQEVAKYIAKEHVGDCIVM